MRQLRTKPQNTKAQLYQDQQRLVFMIPEGVPLQCTGTGGRWMEGTSTSSHCLCLPWRAALHFYSTIYSLGIRAPPPLLFTVCQSQMCPYKFDFLKKHLFMFLIHKCGEQNSAGRTFHMMLTVKPHETWAFRFLLAKPCGYKKFL